MRKIYTIVLAALLGLATMGSASAQVVNFGGTTLDNDIIHWGDMYNLSRTSHSYGTARSMAMGNAFTALGADMVSSMLNPAGIGMYVDGDISFTPTIQLSKSPTTGGDPFYDHSTPKYDREFSDFSSRMVMSSAGAVFSVFKSTKAVTNLNFGFTYNRVADFNQNTLYASLGNPAENSMANIYCTLANVDDNMPLPNSEGRLQFGSDPYFWGPTAAYKNGLLNHDNEGWFIDRIAEDAIINQFSAVETRGAVGEYGFTLGMNLIDKVYIGATIGLQDVDYRRKVFYGESYNYADNKYPSGEEYPYQLEYMNSVQNTYISGSGVNLKLGITARPVEWLRIGVAYHTPTAYNLDFSYDLEMWSATYSAGDNPEDYDVGKDGYFYDDVFSGTMEDTGSYAWCFRSPSRLLVGVSASVGQRLLLSVDYERSWYQTTRLKYAPIAVDHNDAMREVFRGNNTLRLGAEGYILPFLPVRVGYIWSGSALRADYADAIFTHPLPVKESIITAGFGLNFNQSVYLDFAYQYSTTHYSPMQMFYGVEMTDEGAEPMIEIQSEVFNLKSLRHKVVMTLGFRF